MDPVAHTLTGVALGTAGLRRASPLATAALLMGANAPDIDILSALDGPYATLAFRRGWTHGILAVAVWPFVVTGALLLYDRWVRRRWRPAAPGARAGPLIGVTALAVLSHAALDWLNNYGIRLLMPFDGRWFYGDALFIIDPWVWLTLGAAVFLAYSERPAALGAWAVFWMAASMLVLLAPQVPSAARAVWIAGLVALAAARAARLGAGRVRAERLGRAATAVIAAYMAAAAYSRGPAEAAVAREVQARGLGPVEDVMVAPVPADPLEGFVVVDTPRAYLLGHWGWLDRPRFALDERELPKLERSPILDAAAATPEARRFLKWSRYPYAEIETTAEGFVVRFADARYAAMGGIAGPTVRLDRALRPTALERP